MGSGDGLGKASGAGRGEVETEKAVGYCIKYMVFFFNLIFWLIGATLIGLGAWAYIEKNKFFHKDAESVYDILFDVSIIMIVVGVIIFSIAFFGCTGALRENLIMLRVFSALVTIIILLELSGAVLAFVFSDEVKKHVENLLKDEGIVRYRDDADFQSLVDWFQETFDCCGIGVDGYKDWSLNIYFNCTDDNPSIERCAVPFSCCKQQNNIGSDYVNTACGYGTQRLDVISAADVIYINGCIDAILTTGRDQLMIVGGVALACVLLQIVGVVFAQYLHSDIATLKSYSSVPRREYV